MKNKKFGKYTTKAQVGVEAGVGGNVSNISSGFDYTQLLPLANLALSTLNKPKPKNNKLATEEEGVVQNSNLANNAVNQQQKQQQTGQLASTALSTGLNLVAPGLGLIVPATSMIGNQIAGTKDSKYGINYYENYGTKQRIGDTLNIQNRLSDMFTRDEGESNTEFITDLATLGAGSIITGSDNERAKKKVQEMKGVEDRLRQQNQWANQGIYANKGIQFGKYKLHQLTNIPKHKDGVVYNSFTGNTQPAVKKGAGGAIIPFGDKKSPMKVLVENGEYLVKDKENNTIAVLPEKTAKKVLEGEIDIDTAIRELPTTSEAEKAPILKEGASNEQEEEEGNSNTQQQQPAQQQPTGLPPLKLPVPNSENNITMKSLIYETSPLLYALLNKSDKNKTIAKKGLVNEDGYLETSKNKNNPVNIIKSNVITTEGMAFPILANGKKLLPNTGIYKFKEKYVIETPASKCGIHYGKYKTKAQEGIKEKETDDPNFIRQGSNYYMSKMRFPSVYNSKNANDKSYKIGLKVEDEGEETTKQETSNDPNFIGKNSNTYVSKMRFPSMYNPKNPTDKSYNIGVKVGEIEKKENLDNQNLDGTMDVKKVNTFIPREIPANQRYVDPNTAFGYLFGTYQLYKAINDKPSMRGAYTYDPEIANITRTLKYKSKFGDQAGYTEAKKQAAAEKYRAIMNLTNTNTSGASYLNSLSNINANLSKAQQEAYDKFITQEQNKWTDKLNQHLASTHAQERKMVFQDSLARQQEFQQQLNRREQAINQSLKYINDMLAYKKNEQLKQAIRESDYLNSYNEQYLEYALLYGTPEEKKKAQELLRNPRKLYVRPLPINYGSYVPINYKQK